MLPANSACVRRPPASRVDTEVKEITCAGTNSAAASITRRVGVSMRPITFSIVASAPSQCVRCVNSGPATPGKKYFAPPAKPATSCGIVAPKTKTVSYFPGASKAFKRTGTDSCISELGNAFGAQLAQGHQLILAIPLVIEDCADLSRRDSSPADLFVLLGLSHRSVRTLGNQRIKPCHFFLRE